MSSCGDGGVEILVVEDSPTQAERLRHLLQENGFQATVARSGEEALICLSKGKPAMVISDILMPGIDGYELCRRIKLDEELKDLPVVLMSSLSNPTDIIKGLECKADNYITKPFENDFLLSRIQTVLANYRLRHDNSGPKPPITDVDVFFAGEKYTVSLDYHQTVDFLFSTYENAIRKNQELVKTQNELRMLNNLLEERVRRRTEALTAEINVRKRVEQELSHSLEKMQKAMDETIGTISVISETRDPYTSGHERRVAYLARSIAQEMGLSEEQIKGIHTAGLLHDVGKIAVPVEILSKPGKLRKCEFQVITIHPQVSFEILKNIDFPWPVGQMVLQHHERLDGSGYPAGLHDEDIILQAKILTVADVVEALASHRPYRPALGIDYALQEISAKKGMHFAPEVVDACLSLFQSKNFVF